MFSRTVGEIADRHPVHVAPDATLAEVAGAMAARGRGCVFVREDETVSGMITERSLLACLLDVPAAEARAGRAMLVPTPGVAATDHVPKACRLLVETGVKHLAVRDAAGLLVGVVSDMELVGALGVDFMMESSTCQGLMTRTVLTGAPDMPARAVAGALRERGLGGMLTMHGGRPEGIVTEWDLAVGAFDRPQGLDGPVSDFLSSPVVCVPLSGMIYKVILHLRRKNIRHAPVVDESGRIQGILAFSDIIRRAAAFA